MMKKETKQSDTTMASSEAPRVLTDSPLADTLAQYAAKIVPSVDYAIALDNVSDYASDDDFAKQLRIFVEPYLEAGFGVVILACADVAFDASSEELKKYFPKEEAVRMLLKKGMIASYTEHYYKGLLEEFEGMDTLAKEMMEYLGLVQKVAQEMGGA